jgi:hypothetical protein
MVVSILVMSSSTHEVLAPQFFWPRMRRDVERLVARCTTCQKAKSRLSNHGLYMPLPVPTSLGLIYLWTLFWDCLELRRGGIPFLWLLIDSPKWLILYLVIKLMMLAVLLNCSFERLSVYMVFRIQLSMIVMLSF